MSTKKNGGIIGMAHINYLPVQDSMIKCYYVDNRISGNIYEGIVLKKHDGCIQMLLGGRKFYSNKKWVTYSHDAALTLFENARKKEIDKLNKKIETLKNIIPEFI